MPSVNRNSRIRLELILVYHALLYAFGLLYVCGAISWGAWYSKSPQHRLQTDALMRGELAISKNPSDLGHDLCWSEGGVNQVYGLGISVWQLPFEMISKASGSSRFPDLIALSLFMALAAYFILRTLFVYDVCQSARAGEASDLAPAKFSLLAKLGAASLLLFFPPLIQLLRYRLLVYEEVIVYVYFYALLLGCGIVALLRRPTWNVFWMLCALSGIGGLVRPTLVLYGMSTVAVAGLIMVYAPKREQDGGDVYVARPAWNPKLLVGFMLFVAGGGVLFVTNYIRFGSGFEFGHSLNLQEGNLLPSVYSTRFDYPFKHVSLLEAARELLGALFMPKTFKFADWYVHGIFAGQSDTLRWREFFFDTYDISYALLIVTPCLMAIWAMYGRLKISPLGAISLSDYRKTLPHLIVIWAMFAAFLLFCFYLKVPVIASRYMLDFAPAFAISIAYFWRLAARAQMQSNQPMVRKISCLLACLAAWQVSEIAFSRSLNLPSGTITNDDLEKINPSVVQPAIKLPNKYKMGDDMGSWKVPYNGAGWDTDDGSTWPCVIFFVSSPEFLELHVAASGDGNLLDAPLSSIQAKVGLEFLKCRSISRTNDGWMVHFEGPKEHRYQEGLQPVFLAMVPSSQLAKYANPPTPWKLEEISWRTK